MPLIPWLKSHNLSMSFLKEYGVTYDSSYNRLVVPVTTIKRRFCFDLYRNFDEDCPPYEFSIRSCRPHSTLYGLRYSWQDIIQSNYVVVVEGFSDCLALRSHGVLNVCATMTANLSSMQRQILKKFTDTIIVLGDDDPAGRKFAESSDELSLVINGHDPASAIAAGVDVSSALKELL